MLSCLRSQTHTRGPRPLKPLRSLAQDTAIHKGVRSEQPARDKTSEHLRSVRAMKALEKQCFPERTCSICLQYRARIRLTPCQHVATCEVCGDRISKCPICQSVIVDKHKMKLKHLEHHLPQASAVRVTPPEEQLEAVHKGSATAQADNTLDHLLLRLKESLRMTKRKVLLFLRVASHR